MRTTAYAIVIWLAGLCRLSGGGYPDAIIDPANTNNFNTRPRWIVLHTTEDPQGADCGWSRAWFRNPASGVSAHYVICQGGTVYQMVPDEDMAAHAGNLAYNWQSIGIELERHGDQEVSEKQYESLARLVHWLIKTHPELSATHPEGVAPADPQKGSGIIGHNQVPDPKAPTLGGGLNHRHSDPINFDWKKFEEIYKKTPGSSE